MAKPRIALVGCGAVAQLHLMIIDRTRRAEAVGFADKDLSRARELAGTRGVQLAVQDYRELIGKVDAAIVALPHHLHAPIGCDLLENGVHILCEKPMALSTDECDALIASAAKSGATLAVGVARRFYGASRRVKALLDSGTLGRIESFEGSDGGVYSWPVASDFMFKKEAGGGVLADTGAHVLDRLVYWLGDFASVECHDDSDGGVEADCELHLVMQSGAKGVVRLSRSRDLENRWRIRGERGEVELGIGPDAQLTLRLSALGGHAFLDTAEPEDPLDCLCASFEEFVDALEQGRQPLHSGVEGRRSVALMEACRANRRPLEHAWETWKA